MFANIIALTDPFGLKSLLPKIVGERAPIDVGAVMRDIIDLDFEIVGIGCGVLRLRRSSGAKQRDDEDKRQDVEPTGTNEMVKSKAVGMRGGRRKHQRTFYGVGRAQYFIEC